MKCVYVGWFGWGEKIQGMYAVIKQLGPEKILGNLGKLEIFYDF